MVSEGDGTPYQYLKSHFHRTAELVTAPVCTAKSFSMSSTPYHAMHPKSSVRSLFLWYQRNPLQISQLTDGS